MPCNASGQNRSIRQINRKAALKDAVMYGIHYCGLNTLKKYSGGNSEQTALETFKIFWYKKNKKNSTFS